MNLKQYAQSQRVNIRLPKEFVQDDLILLELLYERNYNLVIILPEIDSYYAERLKGKGIPFYFQKLAFTWDDFEELSNMGVSDIFVSGQLGFELDKVSKLAKERKIQIRCYANICQPKMYQDDGLKSFYIRPEDVDFYSNFIDVIQFYKSIDQQNVLYDVYFHSKEWNGKLREIIKGLTSDINNYYILGSEFARRRSQCEKRCLKGERCKLCGNLSSLAFTLEKSEDYEVFKRR